MTKMRNLGDVLTWPGVFLLCWAIVEFPFRDPTLSIWEYIARPIPLLGIYLPIVGFTLIRWDMRGIGKPDYLYDLEKYRKFRARSTYIVLAGGMSFIFYTWILVKNFDSILNAIMIVPVGLVGVVLFLILAFNISHEETYHLEESFKNARKEAGIEEEIIV